MTTAIEPMAQRIGKLADLQRECCICKGPFFSKRPEVTTCSRKCGAVSMWRRPGFVMPKRRNWWPVRTVEQKFMDLTSPEPMSGCWLWVGSARKSIRSGERGTFTPSHSENTVTASRWSYRHFNGPIAPGMMICHRCDNPTCVNPKHLFQGTATDNARDAVNKKRHVNSKKTHCNRGHEFTAENNIRSTPNRRECRICSLENMRAYNRRQSTAGDDARIAAVTRAMEMRVVLEGEE